MQRLMDRQLENVAMKRKCDLSIRSRFRSFKRRDFHLFCIDTLRKSTLLTLTTLLKHVILCLKD